MLKYNSRTHQEPCFQGKAFICDWISVLEAIHTEPQTKDLHNEFKDIIYLVDLKQIS